MKLHIERTKGHLRIIETKEFNTDNYPVAIGWALRYCHDMESEPLNIRLIEELEK